MSFWDEVKEFVKGIPSAIATPIFGAAQGFTASQAARTGAPSEITRRVGQQKLVDIAAPSSAALQTLATPYREFVAEPFVAASFEGMGSGAREFVEGLPGDFGIEESEVAQYVSPGQTIVRTFGRTLPGKQAVEEIDFTNPKQVQDFFSKGAPKFWSGVADLGFTLGLDPFLVGGKALQVGRSNLFTRPIKTQKDLDNAVAEIDAAVFNRPSPFKPIIDDIMSDDVTEADLLASGLFSHATRQEDLVRTFIQAKKLGREAVGDVFKVAIGDVRTLSKVKSQSETARKALMDAEKIPVWVKEELEKPIIGEDFTGITVTQADSILREANDQIKRYAEVDDFLSQILKGTFEAGTEYDGLFGTIRNRTASRYEFLERARVKNAAAARESYWVNNEYKAPDGYTAKILSWLNRGNLQNELPAGFVVTNETVTQRGVREIAANANLIARKTGQPASWSKQKVSQWTKLTSKKERNDFVKEFSDEAMYLIIKNNVPGTKDLNATQLDLLKVLVKEIAQGYKQAQYRELIKVLDNGYHVIDGTESPIYIADMENLLKSIGEDSQTFGAQLKKELEGAPLLESDVPSAVFMPDFDAFERVVMGSPERLGIMVDKIKNSGLDERGLRSQIKKILSSRDVTRLGAERKVDTLTAQLLDYSKITADTFNAVWKPITLLRLGYPIRNVAESGLRIPVAIAALSEELGYSKLALYKGLGPTKETTKVAINNIREYARTRTGKYKLRKGELALITDIDETDRLIVQYTRGLNDSIREGSKYVRELKKIRDSRLQDIDNLFKIAITKFPPAKQKEFARLMDKFIDSSITDSERDKVLELFAVKMQNDKDINEFASYFKFLNEALQNNLDEVNTLLERGARAKAAAKAKGIGRYPISPIEVDLLSKLRQVQEDLLFKNQTLARLKTDRGFLLDRHDSLVNGATPSYRRVNDGTYKAYDGIFINDVYAGTLGEYAFKDISALSTTRNVMGSNIRDSVIANFGRKSSALDVTPDMPIWADAYAKYFNGKLHNDEVAVRVAKGESDSDILKWLQSKDAGAKTYRKNASEGIKEWGGGSLSRFIQAVRVITERNLPDLTDANIDLRKALVEGNLTPQQALRIPQDLRVTVKGYEFMPTEDVTISNAYQKAVNLFFKYIGSLPEDILIRHPLYRSIWQSEIQSLGNLIKAQGKELTEDIVESLSRQAHLRANKTVTETLYTVHRLSGPAQFFRFASPFWMAQQNSSKFWLGESIKNPRIPYLGILAWNSVNEALDARDVDEYNQRAGEYTMPINSGEQIWITMPKGMAKVLGVEDLNVLKFSKDSANLILQGAIPFIPSLGVPIQVPAGMLAKRLAGEKFDPDKELSKLGFAGDTIKEYVFGPRVRGIEGLIPSTAWMQNAFDWFRYEQSPRYWSRVELIVEKKMLELNEAGEPVTVKLASEIYKEASAQARNSLLNGVLFGFTSPVSIQPGSKWELFKSEYRLYTKQYGFEEGSIKFEEDYGPVIARYARSSLSYNPAGLLSTNATLRNINENRELFNEVFLRSLPVAGALVNAGTVDDYSPIVDQKLRDIKVGGETLKGLKDTGERTEQQRQENLCWDRYMRASEQIDSIYANESAEFRRTAKQIAREKIGQEYPIWFEQYGQEIDTNKTPVVQSIITVLNNDKFANSQQGQSSLWQGLRRWAVVREQLADELAAKGRQAADEMTTLRYEEAARRISLDHPEFRPFFERYLSGDKLNIVQTRLR